MGNMKIKLREDILSTICDIAVVPQPNGYLNISECLARIGLAYADYCGEYEIIEEEKWILFQLTYL